MEYTGWLTMMYKVTHDNCDPSEDLNIFNESNYKVVWVFTQTDQVRESICKGKT